MGEEGEYSFFFGACYNTHTRTRTPHQSFIFCFFPVPIVDRAVRMDARREKAATVWRPRIRSYRTVDNGYGKKTENK